MADTNFLSGVMGAAARSVVTFVVASIVILSIVAAASGAGPAQAQPTAAPAVPEVIVTDEVRARRNANIVGLVTGSPGGKYMPLGTDLARLLDDRRDGAMRIVVSFGYGSVQNLDDLLNLQGIDLAIVQSDVLDHFRRDAGQHQQLRQRMRYVTRLHREDIHVLARGDLRSIRALDGKKVAIDVPGSGTQITARNLFDRLGIRPVLVESPPAAARDDLVAGRIDAMMYVVGRGADLFKALSGTTVTTAGLAFVPFADDEGAFAPYESATLEARDYPALIPQGESVKVRAVPSVLAVVAWTPAQRRFGPVARFVERFFDRAGDLGWRPGMQRDLWCQVDLATTVAGWDRFGPAAEWLARNKGRSTRICDDRATLAQGCFQRFNAAIARDGITVHDPTSSFARSLYQTWQATSGRECPVELLR